MAQEKTTSLEKSHNINMENRKKAFMTGIKEVFTFNEEGAVIDTTRGILYLKGSKLHMDKLNLELSELILSGNIDSMIYKTTYRSDKNSFWAKLFK